MRELLKNRNALVIWISTSLSRFGDCFENIALMYLINSLTRSALAMGTVMIFSMIPNLILSPFAGVIADRYNVKKIMFISEIIRAVAILAIPILYYTGYIKVWHIYAISVIVSSAESFFGPASNIAIVHGVQKDLLPVMNSVITACNHIMRTIGYSLAGVLMVVVNIEILFVVDSITFFISAIAAMILILPKSEVIKIEKIKDIGSDMKIGLDYLIKEKYILILIVTMMILSFIVAPIGNFIPITVDKVFKLKPVWGGILLTTFSVGSFCGCILYPILNKMKFKLKLYYLISFPTMGLAILISTMMPSIYTAVAAYFIIGILVSIANMWMSTEFQQKCNPSYIGRVSAVLSMLMLCVDPFASGFFGYIIDRIAMYKIYIAVGICTMILGCILYKKIEGKVIKKDVV